MNYRIGSKYFCIIAILIIHEAEGTCVTPWGKTGECVNMKDCLEMLMMVSRKPVSPMIEKIIQRARCGVDEIDDRVCCEMRQNLHPKRNREEEAVVNGDDDGSCLKRFGQRGNCINIKKCEAAVDILQRVPLTEADRSLLRSVKCGFENGLPRVCCDILEERRLDEDRNGSCLTPWGKIGECIDINYCDDMRMLLRRTPLPAMHEKLIENARCGGEGSAIRVCCEARGSVDIQSDKRSEVARKHRNSRLLADDLCGPIPESRIVGGNNATIYEFPWMALLGYRVGERGIDFRCGGTLINEKYILTAAHCLTALPSHVSLMIIRIGEYNLETERDCDEEGNCAEKYQEFGIESVRVHENYSERSHDNDIGLVRLRGTVDFRPENIRPICLPLDPMTSAAVSRMPHRGTVTGWGATEFGTKSKVLQKITLPILHEDICRKAYEKMKFVRITNKEICAGGVKDMDSCSGDSGGPLQAVGMYGNRPSFIQYGIVSYGPQTCGLEGTPGVYTKVSHHVQWILDNMKE